MRRTKLNLQVGLLVALFPVFGGAFCDDDPFDPATGNFDRIGDVVLVTPESSDEHPHTYAVFTNPEIEQIRVYDLLERRFVRAPNAFFPLSIKTGPATRQLTRCADDETRIYALDGARRSIQVIRTINEDGKAAFTQVGDTIATGSGAHDLACAQADDRTYLFVSLANEGTLQVFDIETSTGTGNELTRIDLGSEAYPSGIAFDPYSNVLVVGDFVLDSVAVVTVSPLALNRRIDVHAPTESISVGRVDTGDGIAPVAMLTQATSETVAVIRLRRESYREDPYVLHGRAHVPGMPMLSYVPDQGQGAENVGPTICCPGVTVDGEATRSWGLVVNAAGEVHYINMNASQDGSRFSEGGLVRLIDNLDLEPAPAGDINSDDNIWYPSQPIDSYRPTLYTIGEDNYGDPPVFPRWKDGSFIQMFWEGTLPNASKLIGTYASQTFSLVDQGESFDAVDIEVGDLLVIRPSETSSSCQNAAPFEKAIVSFTSTSVTVAALTSTEEDCLLESTDLVLDVRANSAFAVHSSQYGYLGRLKLATSEGAPTSHGEVTLPGMRIFGDAADEGAPTRDSQIVFSLTQNVATVGMDLSQVTAQYLGEVDRISALLPVGIAGGEMYVEQTQDAVPSLAKRMVLVTGAGRILEFNETETNDIFVIGPTSY